MLTQIDLGPNVNIEHCASGQNFTFVKLYWIMYYKVDKENLVHKVNIAKIMNVDINTLFILCRPKVQSPMST